MQAFKTKLLASAWNEVRPFNLLVKIHKIPGLFLSVFSIVPGGILLGPVYLSILCCPSEYNQQNIQLTMKYMVSALRVNFECNQLTCFIESIFTFFFFFLMFTFFIDTSEQE